VALILSAKARPADVELGKGLKTLEKENKMSTMSGAAWVWASLLLYASAAMATEVAPPAAARPQGEMVLWYRQPGEKWLDAMPLGNGLVGAMVFGGTAQERIALNESSFWTGRPHDYDPEALKYFPQIRDLVFAGKFQEAEKMADEHFFGVPANQQAYSTLGDLMLTFEGVEKADEYRRELDMETGVALVRYRAGDVVLTREVFISYPDRVMVVRIAADKPGRISFRAQLKSPYLDTVTAKAGKLVMDGTWKGPGAVKNGRGQGPAVPGRPVGAARRRKILGRRGQPAYCGGQRRHAGPGGGHQLRELPRHQRRPRGPVREDAGRHRR
jgi:hypothetical protein